MIFASPPWGYIAVQAGNAGRYISMRRPGALPPTQPLSQVAEGTMPADTSRRSARGHCHRHIRYHRSRAGTGISTISLATLRRRMDDRHMPRHTCHAHVCVCLHVCVYVYVYLCMCAHGYYADVFVCMVNLLCVCVCVCVCLCMRMRMCACGCACVLMHVCLWSCACVYVHVCILG